DASVLRLHRSGTLARGAPLVIFVPGPRSLEAASYHGRLGRASVGVMDRGQKLKGETMVPGTRFRAAAGVTAPARALRGCARSRPTGEERDSHYMRSPAP